LLNPGFFLVRLWFWDEFQPLGRWNGCGSGTRMSGAGMSAQEPHRGGVNTKLLAMDTIGGCSQVKEPLVASMSCSSENVGALEDAGTLAGGCGPSVSNEERLSCGMRLSCFQWDKAGLWVWFGDSRARGHARLHQVK
jgi:hypothetical protein